MSQCKHCNKVFQEQKRPNAQICNCCRVSKKRWKSKIELVEKLGGKCESCGFVGHPGAFHFHHKDPKQKSFEINGNKLLTEDRWNEIEKCQLLCANCHQIQHSNTELIRSFGLIE